MIKQAVVVWALVLLGSSNSLGQAEPPGKQAPAPEFKVPAEEARRENPIKPTASSVAEGKRMYGFDCAMCHGKAGDGQGDLAKEMSQKLRDYRDPAALKDRTDGELFYIIAHGHGDMPGEGARAKPEQVWNMVNYIRSLAQKESPPKPKEEKPQ